MSAAAVMPDSMIPNSEVVSILTAEFLTPAEVAILLKVSRLTLAKMRLGRTGVGIELGRVSSALRFPRPPYNPGRPVFPGPV